MLKSTVSFTNTTELTTFLDTFILGIDTLNPITLCVADGVIISTKLNNSTVPFSKILTAFFVGTLKPLSYNFKTF